MKASPNGSTEAGVPNGTGMKGTTAARAYGLIKASILNGRFLPGTHLKEENLASELGVSRTPIRNAMMRLAAEGMVQYTPNQGMTVRVWSHADITEIFSLRAMLEGHGAELAAERITAPELSELGRLHEEMAKIVLRNRRERLHELSELNGQFHGTIYRAARSERLAHMLNSLIEVPLVLHTFRSYDKDQLRQSVAHHEELVRALAARDPAWAGAVMRAHILSARNAFKDRTPEVSLDPSGS